MQKTVLRIALRACAVISMLIVAAGYASAASAQTIPGGGQNQNDWWHHQMPVNAVGGILLTGVIGIAFVGNQWRRKRKLSK